MADSKFYTRCVERSEKVSWRISDIFPDSHTVSLDKAFVPGAFAGTHGLPFLKPEELMVVNQIWGASYLNIFAFVEEYITLFTLSIANDASFKNAEKLRAFVRFSEEEIKHQLLFRKFIAKFDQAFGSPCQFLTGEREVASVILSNTKLAVLFLTYHLELVTQNHYLRTIRSRENIEPKFQEILMHHWVEEAHHAQLDREKIFEEVESLDAESVEDSFREYFNIIDAFIPLLRMQAEMNWYSLRAAFGKSAKLDSTLHRDMFIEAQHRGYIDIFLLEGLRHPKFIADVSEIVVNGKFHLQSKEQDLLAIFPVRKAA